MKKTIEEVRDWLLENRVDEDGDLNLMELDFSDFGGDVYIGRMNVQGDLFQSVDKVQGELYQSFHNVQGDLYQNNHEIQGCYFSKGIKVKGVIEFEKPTKILKKITVDELKEMGYELTEDY